LDILLEKRLKLDSYMANSGIMAPQFDSASLLTCDDIDSPVTMLNAERDCALNRVEICCSPELKRTDSTILVGQKRKLSEECTQDEVYLEDGDGFTTPKVAKRDSLAPGAPKKKR
jgi:hypothetical protein